MKRRSQRHRPRNTATKVALASFRPEDWTKWLETVDDRERWEANHADWLRAATASAKRLEQAGLEVVWVQLEPETFRQWCLARGLRNNAEARSRFAAEQIGNLPSPAVSPESA